MENLTDQLVYKGKKLSKFLNGRKLMDDRSKNISLTEDEIFLIFKFIKMKLNKRSLPLIIPISINNNLDFFGWENTDYLDVLLCSTSEYDKKIK
nr:hypothetical protein [Pseudopedobacter sp.]